MSKTSLFDLGPERLNRLLSIGKEDLDAGDDPRAEPSAPTSDGENLIDKPGGWIGRYRLIRMLGEGGMGVVHLAEQEHPIKRLVALKVIKPGMDSKRVIARFEAERQALALLDHPNIASVHDAGTTETGRPYFVMEYVKGLAITEHCDRHKLTIEDRLNLFRQICLGVHHAHQKGIIHRDIKPSNILVSMQDDQATPKIIDFGVAKAIAQPLTERTLATEDSQLLGTPEYMSPEQAEMATEDIDTRSDIYSLGVLLYVLLTGILPFDSKILRTSGIDRIRQIIRETDPKTPSTRLTGLGEEAKKVAEKRQTEVGALTKCLHRELEWIPLKAMRKGRSERYRSASEFADDIENYLKGNPLIAGPPSNVYRLKKFVRRNRPLVTGIAAVLVVLLGGVVVSTLFALGQARARAETERQAKISEAVSTFLRDDLLASVDPARGRGRDVTIRSFLDTASENLDGKFTNEPLVEASLRNTLGWTYRQLGEIKAAEPHLERALHIRQEHLGAEHPETFDSVGRLAWLRMDQGWYKEAAELLEKSLATCRRILGDENVRTLTLGNALGCSYNNLGRYHDAEQLYLKGVPTARRVLGEKNNLSLFMVGNLGRTYTRQGRYDEAEHHYIEVLRLRDGFGDDENIYTLLYKGSLAGVYGKQKRYEEAETLYLEILPIQRKVDGPKHYRTLWKVSGLAIVYKEQARYEEAEPLLLEALEAHRLRLGDTHPQTLESLNHLIELYEAWDKPEDAEQWRAKLPAEVDTEK